MTDSLILPVGTKVRRLSEEILLHIEEKHARNKEESMVAYEALSRLSLAFHLSKSNCRLPIISYSEEGKPFFSEYPQFSFSLSHSDGMAAAVMSDSCDVGIDIEKIRLNRLPSCRLLAESRFFEGERALLLKNNASELEEIKSFLSIWTKKEAVAKILQKPPISIDTFALPKNVRTTLAIHEEKYVVCVAEIDR